jgi:ABC-type amino acid transport system permease subunit
MQVSSLYFIDFLLNSPGPVLASFMERFRSNFIIDDRWKYLLSGLKVTLIITFFALLIGLIIGFVVAIIRTSFDKMEKGQPFRKKLGYVLLKLINFICKLYLTIIRGTPVVVQILIIYFVIFASVNIDKTLTAIIAFGFNSGAYVAEIIRSGIMSIDKGQFEAGRSLGLSYIQTMYYIITPQALKNILPALGNEFIVLLKETAVSGYIALVDLTKAGDIIRSRTYDAFMPLIAVALIYLALVMFFTYLVNKLERRLRSSDH